MEQCSPGYSLSKYDLYHETGHAVFGFIITGKTDKMRFHDYGAAAFCDPVSIGASGLMIAAWLDLAGIAAGELFCPEIFKSVPFSKDISDIHNACVNAEKLGFQEYDLEAFYYKQLTYIKKFLAKPEVREIVEELFNKIIDTHIRKGYPSKLSISRPTMEKWLKPFNERVLDLIGYRRKLMTHVDWNGVEQRKDHAEIEAFFEGW